MSFIRVSSICKQNEAGFILNDISFQQQRYQKLAIAGETGSGKSTLLKIIAGLEQADTGEIWMNREMVKGPTYNLVPGHVGISYLSQQFELPKFLRVEQVLSYANSLSSREASNLYHVCRVDHLLQRKTNELSGGEQQRIALARLLSTKPKLLLLDEPYSNLDRMMRNTLKLVLAEIATRLKISMMLVSHDPNDTLSWADEIIVMQSGKIIQQGTPKQIYKEPLDDYTAGLFGSYNVLTPSQIKAFGVGKGSKIVRPENFKIVKRGSKTVSGTILESRFLGDRVEADVKLRSGVIIVLADHPLQVGNKIHLMYRE